MSETKKPALVWRKAAGLDKVAEGRVKPVSVGARLVALVHYKSQYAAMDNHCPHQGGPLGEGSIEKSADGQCWLRCPWHGWDFDPLTGKPPGGHPDRGQEMFPVEVRADGIYIGAAALTIAGPGATNLLTGLWDAKVDNAPALALTGQVQEQVIGFHAFRTGRMDGHDETYAGLL